MFTKYDLFQACMQLSAFDNIPISNIISKSTNSPICEQLRDTFQQFVVEFSDDWRTASVCQQVLHDDCALIA